MHPLLQQLQNKQWLWQGGQTQAPFGQLCASGWPQLDQWLGGGWPQQGMLLLHTATGVGELQLLGRLLDSDKRLLACINPPAQLSAEAWQGQPLSQLWQLQARKSADALWAAEQCLHSGSCHAVLLWQNQLELRQHKRLQLAAQQGQSLLLLLQHQATAPLALPWDLSLQLQPLPDALQLQMLKRKGFARPDPFVLSWSALFPQFFPTSPFAQQRPETEQSPHKLNKPQGRAKASSRKRPRHGSRPEPLWPADHA